MCVDACVDEIKRIDAEKAIKRERDIDEYEGARAKQIAESYRWKYGGRGRR